MPPGTPSTSDSPITRLRTKAGLTQEGLAYKSGLSVSTLARIERGSHPNIATLRKIADTLGCTVVDLLTDVEALAAEPAEQAS